MSNMCRNNTKKTQVIHVPGKGLMQRRPAESVFKRIKERTITPMDRHLWVCIDYREVPDGLISRL